MRSRIESVLGGGGAFPVPNTPETWCNQGEALQRAACATRTGVPLLVGNDTVHGQVHLKGATLFPHHIGLGCTVRGTLPSYTPAAPSWPAHSLTHAQRWWYY